MAADKLFTLMVPGYRVDGLKDIASEDSHRFPSTIQKICVQAVKNDKAGLFSYIFPIVNKSPLARVPAVC